MPFEPGPTPAIAVRGTLTRFGAEQPGYGRYAYLVCKRPPLTSQRDAASVRALFDVLSAAPASTTSEERAHYAITYAPVRDSATARLDAEGVIRNYDAVKALEIVEALRLAGQGPFIVVSSKPYRSRAHFAVMDLSGVVDEMMPAFVERYAQLMADGVDWERVPPYYELDLLRNALAKLGEGVVRGLDAIGVVGKVLALIAKPTTATAEAQAPAR